MNALALQLTYEGRTVRMAGTADAPGSVCFARVRTPATCRHLSTVDRYAAARTPRHPQWHHLRYPLRTPANAGGYRARPLRPPRSQPQARCPTAHVARRIGWALPGVAGGRHYSSAQAPSMQRRGAASRVPQPAACASASGQSSDVRQGKTQTPVASASGLRSGMQICGSGHAAVATTTLGLSSYLHGLPGWGSGAPPAPATPNARSTARTRCTTRMQPIMPGRTDPGCDERTPSATVHPTCSLAPIYPASPSPSGNVSSIPASLAAW